MLVVSTLWIWCVGIPIGIESYVYIWASPFVFLNYDLKVEMCEMETRSDWELWLYLGIMGMFGGCMEGGGGGGGGWLLGGM